MFNVKIKLFMKKKNNNNIFYTCFDVYCTNIAHCIIQRIRKKFKK